MRGGFRTRIFLATFGVAAAVLLLGSILITVSLRRQTYERIERGLISEARLAAELLSHRAAAGSPAELQEQALAIARDIDARVTLIAADGRVVGDSSQEEAEVAHLENHGARPEVAAARQTGIGISSRSSATLGTDMLYVAAAVRHPSIATVRLALPLTEIRRQLLTIWRVALYALALSVIGAFAMAWLASSLLVRRLVRVATGARRYAAGDPAALPVDYGDDEIGTVSRVLEAVVRQVSERAADLTRDRARMEAILAGMIEGVVVIDGAGRVQLVNAAALRMLRIEGNVIGRHYLECVRQPAVVSQLEAVAEKPAPAAAPPIVREGSTVFVARAAPVMTGAAAPGAVLVLHDITDLYRADQIRRDFVANVSHELRTPLTAIRGYVEALYDEPADPEERRRFLDVIARHTGRMERLTQDLLRLARLDAGQEPPEYAPCNVRDLLDGVVDDLQANVARKQQRVDLAVDSSLDTIVTDPQQLHDALRNLVENAVNYSPAGSTIGIGVQRHDNRVAIAVTDQGPGIPRADLSRVFERFYRIDKARSPESGGTGLGLAIVKHIVERMDGSVRAENGSGGGAVFTIELPIRTLQS
jgi:two-component system phosphate regulon sensor histidine kinase PhoR